MTNFSDGAGIAGFALLGMVLRKLVEAGALNGDDVRTAVLEALGSIEGREPGIPERHKPQWRAACVVLRETLGPLQRDHALRH